MALQTQTILVWERSVWSFFAELWVVQRFYTEIITSVASQRQWKSGNNNVTITSIILYSSTVQ